MKYLVFEKMEAQSQFWDFLLKKYVSIHTVKLLSKLKSRKVVVIDHDGIDITSQIAKIKVDV